MADNLIDEPHPADAVDTSQPDDKNDDDSAPAPALESQKDDSGSPKPLKRRASSPSSPESKRAKLSPSPQPQPSPSAAEARADTTEAASPKARDDKHGSEDRGESRDRRQSIDGRSEERKAPVKTLDEKARSKRLFGGLLSTIAQKPSGAQRQKRAEIEQRQAERARQREVDEEERRRELAERRREERVKEQVRWDWDAMLARHENMLEKAHCIATKAKPVIYYRPYLLLPHQKRIIAAQILDTKDTIADEIADFRSQHRADIASDPILAEKINKWKRRKEREEEREHDRERDRDERGRSLSRGRGRDRRDRSRTRSIAPSRTRSRSRSDSYYRRSWTRSGSRSRTRSPEGRDKHKDYARRGRRGKDSDEGRDMVDRSRSRSRSRTRSRTARSRPRYKNSQMDGGRSSRSHSGERRSSHAGLGARDGEEEKGAESAEKRDDDKAGGETMGFDGDDEGKDNTGDETLSKPEEKDVGIEVEKPKEVKEKKEDNAHNVVDENNEVVVEADEDTVIY